MQVLGVPARRLPVLVQPQRSRIDELRSRTYELHLPAGTQFVKPVCEPLDDAVLPASQRSEIDLGVLKGEAPLARFARFVDQTGHVQQRFGGDAPAMQTDAAWLGIVADQRYLHSQFGSVESGRVTAGAAADDR